MRLLKNLLFASALVIGFSACDRVPYSEAYEKQPPVVVVDTNNYQPVTNYARKVLIEDYTGHTCGNCPYAAMEAHRIEEAYPGKVLVMGIHCGFFAEPKNYPNGSFKTDFRTAVGNALDNEFKASAAGLPRGVVGRRKFDNSYLLLHTDWDPKVAGILSEPSSGVGISINPKYTSSDSSLVVYTQIAFQKQISGELKIACYLLEDSIITWQKIYPTPSTSQNIEFYVHNHVLRGSLLPSNGQDLVTTKSTFVSGDSFKSTWQTTIPSWVKPENSKVLTIVYRTDTKEILQAEEADIL